MQAEESRTDFPQEMKEISDLIARQRSQYMGTLLGGYLPVSPWEEHLARFKKPIIRLRPYLHIVLMEKNPYLVTCMVDEKAAIKLAVDALAGAGHRTIGMLRGFRGADHAPIPWIEDRIDLLKKAASEYYPDIKIIIMDQDEEFWHDQKWRISANLFPLFLQDLAREKQQLASAEKSDGIASIHEGLRRCSPGLWNLVNYQGLTALIAANDLRARLYNVWLKQMGIPVPRNLSLIGFDNDLASRYHPISTIDFGLTDLGYLAAHVAIGDIPVSMEKRFIRSRPILISRGSIEPPGRL